jgi:DNA-binding transcriptional LysR family regulator
MNWDDLRIFLSVARFGRHDLAARQLRLGAATVGRKIARLESSVGATLLEHSRGGYVLTETGRRIFKHAEDMEHCVVEASVDKAGATAALTGFVRVSVSEAFGTWILPRYLDSFTQAHPGLTIDLVASGGFLSPSRREADVAVMLARPARGPLITRRLTDYALGLYASRDYLDRAGTPGSVEELVTHRLVGFIPDLVQVPQQRLFEEISEKLTPSVRSTSINAQAALVSASGGIGILPRFVGERIADVVPVLTTEVNLTRTFWLVVHKDVRRLARVDAFVGWLTDIFRQEAAFLRPSPVPE